MGSGLYRRSWTSLSTTFVSAQRLSKRTVYAVETGIAATGLPPNVNLGRHLVPSVISRGALCKTTPETSVSKERKGAKQSDNLAYNLRLPR
jgi:hypothetical protein